ncbi:MAG: asparagine synthase (glutamine-hydrolyzing) [Verrucomicrobiae bacterium]|nr:asparagine synthase (glutamine-hydrolyzing) [Verrucomicrobiae bacterium]
MCGFFAWFHPFGLAGRETDIRTATDLMSHRGPDGSGLFVENEVGLGHRRLSIIDLSGGTQPFHSEDGRYVLVYNGEVYNFAEIRKALESKGRCFRTNSDTEVILQSYEEWGTACLERFNGMFAFAIWDRISKELWVVRDRMGVKPVYYWTDGVSFAAASEIRPLLSIGVQRKELDETVVDAYLSLGYVPAPRTMFKGISKLEPGTWLKFSCLGVQREVYWDFAAIEQRESDPDDEARLFELLVDCTQACTVSDVPIGVLLSGGLDSSATVALMHEAGIGEINTFTVGYDGSGTEDESEYARMVASRYHTRHFAHILGSSDFFESLDLLVNFTEEPLVEPAAIALYQLSKMARNEVKVLLSGEGSDEIFAGYGIYQRMLTLERIHASLPEQVWSWTGAIKPYLSHLPFSKYLDWATTPLENRFKGTSANLPPSKKHRLFHKDFLEKTGGYLDDTFSNLFAKLPPGKSALGKLLYIDSKTWLPDDLLLKADKMTMAASIELRVPFLDHRLVEFASELPDHARLFRGESKRLFRRSLADLLPGPVLTRKKMGFPVPTRRWFSSELSPLIRDLLENSPRLPWIDPNHLLGILKAPGHLTEEQGRLLMTLLVLDFWRRSNNV